MEMVNSKELGIAIDIILEEVKKHIHEPISKNQVTKILECGVNNTGFKRVGKKEG